LFPEHQVQHPTSTAIIPEEYMPSGPALKYLLYTLIGALLIVTQSPALMAVVALGFGFSLAVQERLRKLKGNQDDPTVFASGHWVSDGGSFPGQEPKTEAATQQSPRVIDGGSLERHRF
jgi:hypothetical protein